MKPLTFLQDATREQLLRAIAANHTDWMARHARSAGGGVYRERGAAWVYQPGKPAEVAIPFPRLTDRTAGERIDAILQFCRAHRPIHQVSCWTLDAGWPPDLGARLAARGFNWGWQPHWMALDLRRMAALKPLPSGVRIEEVAEQPGWDAPELPNFRREGPVTWRKPQRVWHHAAFLDGRVVGHSMLNLTTGRLGVAGIFAVGVVPHARNRGIGSAVTAASCRTALALGCRYAVLNATPMGIPMYRRLGFESLGWGMTWWMREESLDDETLRFPPPTPDQVAFVEAIGRGDVAALDALNSAMTPAMLDAPILGRRMTPMALAVEMKQSASVEWLLRHGAAPDVTGG